MGGFAQPGTMLGTRLGSYEIAAAIGAGGMGEVYRGRDASLNRDVAIKVLPVALAADSERLARFKREAQTLASLNHPNIAAIYGVEDVPAADGSGTKASSRALVMELVEGEDLAERLKRGAIPVDESIAIAKQIAEGLEEAHEHGIIHRDLKPANVKVTPDGKVKILDFGLAKAMEGDPAASGSAELSHSPTLTRQGTEAGMILGTAAYMAPEQAKGKTVDRRTDLWAFGVVLYEMLTGQRLFAAEDVSETLAAVLTREVNLATLPAGCPARLRDLIRDCLVRDPKQRLRDAGDARITLGRVLSQGPDDKLVATAVRGWRRHAPWLVSGALAIALVAALVGRAPGPKAPQSTTSLRLNVDLGVRLVGRSPLAFSRDGQMLAFTGQRTLDEPVSLHVQRLDQEQATVVAGTEDAGNPFFSPDGKWVAFFAGGKLKKVEVAGGPVATLADSPDSRGGTWSENDSIIVAPTTAGGLMSIPPNGGTPTALTTLGELGGDSSHRWPQALPGGRAVLFTIGAGGDFEDATIAVQPSPREPWKALIHGGYHARYLERGHLVYIHGGTMMAAPFDPKRLEITGPPVPVLENVDSNASNAGATFSVSPGGALVYQAEAHRAMSTLAWTTRDGSTEPLLSRPGRYLNPLFSPDGERLSLDLRDEGANPDVWVYDVRRGAMSRLTFDPAIDETPIWSPGGTAIAFASRRDGLAYNLYWQRADGAGEAVLLVKNPFLKRPLAWHPSGRFLAFVEVRTGTSLDVMILPLQGDEKSGWKGGEPYPFVATPFREAGAAFSPDGRWLAYHSNESGRHEVYVRPFPGPGGSWQISTEGGWKPMWSKRANELVYSTQAGALMTVPYTVEGGSFHPTRPRPWTSRTFLETTDDSYRLTALHPDGARMAVVMPDSRSVSVERTRVVFVQDFSPVLRRLAPSGGK